MINNNTINKLAKTFQHKLLLSFFTPTEMLQVLQGIQKKHFLQAWLCQINSVEQQGRLISKKW